MTSPSVLTLGADDVQKLLKQVAGPDGRLRIKVVPSASSCSGVKSP